MLTTTEIGTTGQVVFADRILPDGSHVLVPQIVLPRTCRRLDGATKVCYATRAEAKAARTKHDAVYHCPNCGTYHLATRHRHSPRPIAHPCGVAA